MRKFRILSVLLITALTFSVGHATPPITIKEVYTSQIGVREATGQNDGKAVEMYLKKVGLSKGNAWCSAFVRWCFDQVGIKTSISAWSPTAYNPKHQFFVDHISRLLWHSLQFQPGLLSWFSP